MLHMVQALGAETVGPLEAIRRADQARTRAQSRPLHLPHYLGTAPEVGSCAAGRVGGSCIPRVA